MRTEETTDCDTSRRRFIGAAGAATVAALGPMGQSASAQEIGRFDLEYDVVICGSGAGGLGTALFSRWHGNNVLVLEKAGSVGGTSAKSAFWYWIPNNTPMRKAGIADPKPDFMKLVARITACQSYDPSLPKLGLTDWQYAMCEAFYDSAAPAADLLNDKGALLYRHSGEIVDYWAELPENKAPKGRCLMPEGISDSLIDGGLIAIRNMSTAARRAGVTIKTSHRVQGVAQNSRGEVIGVEVMTPDESLLRVRAKKAVVFATGGFTHDSQLTRDFLSGPIFGGCAAPTNEGDLIRISSTLGAQLGNMNYAWNSPVLLEKAIANDGAPTVIFPSGDSMFIVNKYGRRVVNEKLQYNEITRTFWQWDGNKAEYSNLLLIAVWDQRAQDHSGATYGFIAPPGGNDRHVIKGASWAELAKNIAARIAQYRAQVNFELAPDFLTNLRQTVARYNGFARTGKDLDFQRGERPVEFVFNGPSKPERAKKNATMWPLSDKGPFYAALLGAGALDTKGGPITDTDCRILHASGKPIPGLYGVGNCVASASGAGYWAGGATIGPIIASAYRAANALQLELVKEAKV